MSRTIKYPDDKARKTLLKIGLDAYFEYQILWMLIHNDHCTVDDFRNTSKENKYEGILEGVLRLNLGGLTRLGCIKKGRENKYKITKEGKKRIKLLETRHGYVRLY
ncbi:MAG: hypothetical protein ACFE96_03500 [Candidatus Hermodarchaeota archaeon]